MKRFFSFLGLACAVVFSSAWLVRLGMQSIIPLPVSDSMVEFALEIYRAQDQEEVANLLATLGLLIWVPVMALFFWGLVKIGARR